MGQEPYFTSCGLMKTYHLAAPDFAGICTLFMILRQSQRLEPHEMQLNLYCSFSADRSLVEELYSVGFFMTLSVMII